MTAVTRPIVHALGFGALILFVSLAAKLAFVIGWVDDAELSQRLAEAFKEQRWNEVVSAAFALGTDAGKLDLKRLDIAQKRLKG